MNKEEQFLKDKGIARATHKATNLVGKEVNSIVDLLREYKEKSSEGRISVEPSDEQVKEWFTDNIDQFECSASSAIHKYRIWRENFKENNPKNPLKEEAKEHKHNFTFDNGLFAACKCGHVPTKKEFKASK